MFNILGEVSRESVRMDIIYDVLNGLYICMTVIMNAYLKYPSSQNDCVIFGTEFLLENVGNKSLIMIGIYGGKDAGRGF